MNSRSRDEAMIPLQAQGLLLELATDKLVHKSNYLPDAAAILFDAEALLADVIAANEQFGLKADELDV